MANSNTGVSDEQLFTGLVADLITQAWVAMGKIKNPITDKLEPNLQASAMLIDMLEMLGHKTEGHLSDEESKLLNESLQQLKLNYITEKDAADKAPPEEETTEALPDATEGDEKATEPTTESDS